MSDARYVPGYTPGWVPQGEAGALISADQVYRYALWRPVPEPYLSSSSAILWVMLNPSTADATRDDNTIRAIKRISQALGYPRILVGNLYGYRARDPRALKRAADPVGPDNDKVLRVLAGEARTIVAAWGTHAEPARATEVVLLLRGFNVVHCLGTNFDGTPKHPLFLKTETPLETYA